MTATPMPLLVAALRADTLDAALAPIIQAFGVPGDCAAHMFSGLGDDEWSRLSYRERRAWLQRWLEFELIDAEHEALQS